MTIHSFTLKWECMGKACRACLTHSNMLSATGKPLYQIVGISVDTTACSVVALDSSFRPLRRCLLWCDARSAPQCKHIMEVAHGDPALEVNCHGEGPLSAEWMIPKALWIKENEPEVWAQAAVICEKQVVNHTIANQLTLYSLTLTYFCDNLLNQDYVNYLLTGRLCASGCNVAARWHWDADKACSSDHQDHDSNRRSDSSSDSARDNCGRPVSLLRSLHLTDLLDKVITNRLIPNIVLYYISPTLYLFCLSNPTRSLSYLHPTISPSYINCYRSYPAPSPYPTPLCAVVSGPEKLSPWVHV